MHEVVDLKDDLKREIGILPAIATVVGLVIGSGVFFKPGKVFASSNDVTWGILAWVLGGLITLFAGLTVAELGAAIPQTGGLYAWLYRIYGKLWSFLYGWIYTVIVGPATIAALAIIFATQVQVFFPISDLAMKLVAIGLMLILTVSNYFGARYGGYIQTVSTIAKLIPIVLIIIVGLARGTGGQVTGAGAGFSGTGFSAALVATLWAYDGWITVGNISGELKNPRRDLPIAIIAGIAMVAVVYIAINIAIVNTLPLDTIARAGTTAINLASAKLFGDFGATLLAIGIMISIFGCLNGHVLTDPRIPFAMAQQGDFPAFLKKISPYKTPTNGFVVQSILASLYILTGTFDALTNIVVFTTYIFFVAGMVGVIILRQREPELHRPYKVPLYPVIPILGILGGIYILYSTLTAETAQALYGIAVTLLGIPVFYYFRRGGVRIKPVPES
ncbi:amino acid permease-associated region [Desulfotomaculum nigrificans CO-1-SRB]|uniref:Amino acid permease-associated region n=1 Tax=Desulfotomaculum nigrificans (strain DSM 14880 / VKM B-2319 / CO-1-SRB) TaxID=868595 RepID=F6B2Y9_DESCC|nr:amino acid permease [Desulfotomaculum nigrificans]AEF95097.1 amino acid permease-associated region [Desulfotomaculum nigrificans CO-1-SRB]